MTTRLQKKKGAEAPWCLIMIRGQIWCLLLRKTNPSTPSNKVRVFVNGVSVEFRVVASVVVAVFVTWELVTRVSALNTGEMAIGVTLKTTMIVAMMRSGLMLRVEVLGLIILSVLIVCETGS